MDGIKEGTNRLVDEVNRYTLENEQYQKIIMEKRVAMKTMKRSLLGLKRRVVGLEAGKELLLRTNEELVSTGRRQGARGSRMEERSIETDPPVYLGFPYHAEKAAVPCCSREFSEPGALYLI